MKIARSRGLATAFLAWVVLLTLAAPAAAGDQVPFKGRLEGTASITPIAPPVVAVVIHATGNATHLGRFTLEAPHMVNQATLTGVGIWVLTAANGDTVTADFSGQATLLGPDFLSIVETGTITGGTGRFAGATGSFTVERRFSRVTGITTGSFEGSISSPGAGS